MKDKRKYPRLPVRFTLRYRAEGVCECDAKVGAQECVATVVNISEGGLGVLMDTPLSEMTKLDIEFHLALPDRSLPSVSAVGQVCYNFPLAAQKFYHTGIEFIMINKKDRETIAAFVRTRSQQERKS